MKRRGDARPVLGVFLTTLNIQFSEGQPLPDHQPSSFGELRQGVQAAQVQPAAAVVQVEL